jgi:hypothetical protein
MKKLLPPITASIAMLTGMIIPVPAATITGDLFATSFQNQSGQPGVTPTTNVWKVSFTYNGTTLTLGSPVAIKTLTGADGIAFDPNDSTHGTLLIGEQNSNRVAQLSTDGLTLIEKKADGSQPQVYLGAQAYGVQPTPNKAALITLPNDANPFGTSLNISPLAPLGDGTRHQVTGVSAALRGLDFRQGVAYWGDANDQDLNRFGTIDLSTFITSLVPIVDDVDHTAGQGSLPSHGVTYDSFSDCFILTSGNKIWQVCPKVDGNFHIVGKIHTPGATNTNPVTNPNFAADNWDQVSVDGNGHLFAANNDGDLLFIDYAATGNIQTATHQFQNFLVAALDDIVNGGGVLVPAGCPATKGFWHDPSLHAWPTTTVTVGGVTYNGATDQSMIIGGKQYSQAQLLALMPTSGGAGGNGFVITGSQLIAAVLNVANGAAHSASVDAAIKAANDLLAVDGRMVGTSFGVGLTVNPAPANNNALKNAGTALDAYNSSAGTLGCIEGTSGK